MKSNHTPGMMYPVGTRYSNSQYYDAATARVACGFQVFEQFSPDGKPTGRESFVDQSGSLCHIDSAESKRNDALKSASPDLLKALKGMLAAWPYIDCAATIEAKQAVALAEGLAEEVPPVENRMADIPSPVRSVTPLSGLAIAGIGVKHFGNPIPQSWFPAARELQAALVGEMDAPELAEVDRSADRSRGG